MRNRVRYTCSNTGKQVYLTSSMNRIISKFLLIVLGVSVSNVAIEVSSASAVMAERPCDSYKLEFRLKNERIENACHELKANRC
jgi:hypothetical protein